MKETLRRFFTEVIGVRDIQTSASLGRRSSFSRVHGNAPLPYKLGLTRDVGLGEDVRLVNRAPFNQFLGESFTFRGNTNVALFRKLTFDVGYQRRRDRSQTNNLPGRIQDDVTWPEIRFNWGDIHKSLPLIRSIFTDFRTVSTSYSRVTSSSGTSANERETVSTTTNWRPLFSVQGTLRGGWQTNVSANRSTTQTVSQRTGSIRTTNNRTQVNYTVGMRKKFSRGAGARDVDLSIDLSYSKNTSRTESAAQRAPQEDGRDQIRLGTTAGLRFTRSMSGTIGLEVGQERQLRANITRRNVRVSFSTGFTF